MFVSRDFEILLKWKSAWIFYYIQNLSYLYDWVKLAISILIETFTIFNHKYFANLIWTISDIECKCILYTQLDEREVFFSTNLFRFSPLKRRKISNHFANKMALLVVAFVFRKKNIRKSNIYMKKFNEKWPLEYCGELENCVFFSVFVLLKKSHTKSITMREKKNRPSVC